MWYSFVRQAIKAVNDWKEMHTMNLYDLQIVVEELQDGGDYQYLASSPDLPNLLVVGDTVEEVLTLAPQVASALIASLKLEIERPDFDQA